MSKLNATDIRLQKDAITRRVIAENSKYTISVERERDSYKAKAELYKAELERLRDVVGEKDVEIIDNVLEAR